LKTILNQGGYIFNSLCFIDSPSHPVPAPRILYLDIRYVISHSSPRYSSPTSPDFPDSHFVLMSFLPTFRVLGFGVSPPLDLLLAFYSVPFSGWVSWFSFCSILFSILVLWFVFHLILFSIVILSFMFYFRLSCYGLCSVLFCCPCYLMVHLTAMCCRKF
jgi:hypothetical protein